MTTIAPEGVETLADSTPLEVSEEKRTEMVSKAVELLTEAMEPKELMDALEQHYVASNEHYTPTQLTDIIDQVVSDLTPAE